MASHPKKTKIQTEKPTPKADKPDAVLTQYQRYDEVIVHRSELKNAPYNPRRITEAARRKLKKVIAKHGLVAPITWNARTGNIVAGHQRVSILDALHKNHHYKVKVAKIDVDERDEKELNLALNNAVAQGDWDLEKLEPLLREVDVENAGFDASDIYSMFGFDAVSDKEKDLESLAEQLRELQERDVAMREKETDPSNLDIIGYYRVLVFGDYEEADDWAERSGLPLGEMFYPGRGTTLIKLEEGYNNDDNTLGGTE